jgi:hypothetical protein
MGAKMSGPFALSPTRIVSTFDSILLAALADGHAFANAEYKSLKACAAFYDISVENLVFLINLRYPKKPVHFDKSG